jgi:hypothetical protein
MVAGRAGAVLGVCPPERYAAEVPRSRARGYASQRQVVDDSP